MRKNPPGRNRAGLRNCPCHLILYITRAQGFKERFGRGSCSFTPMRVAREIKSRNDPLDRHECIRTTRTRRHYEKNGKRRTLLFFWPAALGHPESHWQPAVDIYRTEGEWIVKFELAGIQPQDVEILVKGGGLAFAGDGVIGRSRQGRGPTPWKSPTTDLNARLSFRANWSARKCARNIGMACFSSPSPCEDQYHERTIHPNYITRLGH